MSKVKLEHERLESTMATAVALFNEWIKWCDANGVGADKMPMIARLFEKPAPKQPTKKRPVVSVIEDTLLDMLFKGRYGKMKRCPRCWEKPAYQRVSNRKCFSCSYCGHQIFPYGGTLLHKSTTPAVKWLLAYYLIATNPKITAESLQEYIGVTYKTAWRMRDRIKNSLASYEPYNRQQPKRKTQ